jgi:hypothetical protein
VTKVTIVVREVGRLRPDYSLDFDLPAVPHAGDYVSIQRPDNPEPYGEDLIVQKVWWRLKHPETGSFRSNRRRIGGLTEILIECAQAIGPYSSDQWRDALTAARAHGAEVSEFEVARLSNRQDELTKK